MGLLIFTFKTWLNFLNFNFLLYSKCRTLIGGAKKRSWFIGTPNPPCHFLLFAPNLDILALLLLCKSRTASSFTKGRTVVSLGVPLEGFCTWTDFQLCGSGMRYNRYDVLLVCVDWINKVFVAFSCLRESAVFCPRLPVLVLLLRHSNPLILAPLLSFSSVLLPIVSFTYCGRTVPSQSESWTTLSQHCHIPSTPLLPSWALN